jgi:hypothetical protein
MDSMERLDGKVDEDLSAFADLRGSQRNENIIALSSRKMTIFWASQQRVLRLSLSGWVHK